MTVPLHSIPQRGPRPLPLRVLSLPLLFLLLVPPLLARTPEPPLRIPLEPLGFQPQLSQFLLAGSSLFTVHYVDDSHLLLTFTVRRLLSRLPNDPEDDQDRNVDALLLELPSGKVVARTSWRLHDHGQYLWSLGHGRFLLRVRDDLTTFAPLANLPTGQPFRERPFLSPNRRISAMLLSPDSGLLIVESIARTPPTPRPKTPLFGPTPAPAPARSDDPTPVQINFYRLFAPNDAGEEIQPRIAGIGHATNTGSIATTAAGYLDIIDQGRQHWAFDFDSYAGKKSELSPFDSACRPLPLFVSRSEFIAFGCHSSNTRQLLGGFNMRGEEMWEQNLFGDYLAPSLAFAPSSGRFALSRILVHSSSVMPDQPLISEDLAGQSIVVYQTSSGKQVIRVECSPVERAGQNFDLAPSGLSLAVIHAEAIEIYSLPPLTTKEAGDIKLAEASAPEDTNAPIRFAKGQTGPAAAEASAAAQDDNASDPADTLGPDATQGTSPAPASAAAVSASPTSQQPGAATSPLGDAPPTATSAPSGDATPNQPRKPPTLYTLPTDPPHAPQNDQPKNDQPQ
jgi:hypothetical protein